MSQGQTIDDHARGLEGACAVGDQADALRRLIWSSDRASNAVQAVGRTLVAVHGIGAGCGATTTALQLALAMQRRDREVILIDGDRKSPWIHQACGLTPHGSLTDVRRQLRTLSEIGERGPCGVTVVAGDAEGSGEDSAWREGNPVFEQSVRAADRRLVIVDLPAWEDFIAVMPRVSHCLLLTRADPDAITSVYRTLKTLTGWIRSACCWLGINEVEDLAEAKEAVGRLERACDRFLNLALDRVIYLPHDPACQLTKAGPREPSRWEPALPYRRAIEPLVQRLETQWIHRCPDSLADEVAMKT